MAFAIKEHQTAVLSTTRIPVRIVAKTASYTPVLADANKIIEVDSVSATTLTIPPNSSVAYDVGVVIGVYQHDVGTVSMAPGAGVTILSAIAQTGTRALSGRYSEGSLRKRDTDVWVLVGDLA
jgi:hypothetical protein